MVVGCADDGDFLVVVSMGWIVSQGVVVEAACMIELAFLQGGAKLKEKHPEVTVSIPMPCSGNVSYRWQGSTAGS